MFEKLTVQVLLSFQLGILSKAFADKQTTQPSFF